MRNLILSLCIACSSFMLQAQSVNGIRVDAGDNLVLVYMDGKQISLPTSSCFIANLTNGQYAIEVYDANAYRSGEYNYRGKLVFRESIRYRGRGIKQVTIEDYVDDEDSDYPDDPFFPGGHYVHNVMSPKAFAVFFEEFKDRTFESKQLKMLETAVVNTNFTSAQCAKLITACSFDRVRLECLKRLYPAVVDKQNFFMVVEKFDFNSYKDDMNEFIQEYHKTHRR